MPTLTVRRGPEPGKSYPINAEVVQIGRGARNDIVIEDNEVSRDHCRLVRAGEHYELLDLDSSNGTFVNGHRVRENWPLRADCLIELGDSITLAYELATARTTSERPSAPAPAQRELFFVVKVANQPNHAIYPLRGDTVDVGRGTANDIIIVEAEMSRSHMRLRRMNLPNAEIGYDIVDLNSTNGTTVNGTEVHDPRPLRVGDVIRVGTTITIQYTDDPETYLSAKGTDLYDAKPDDMKSTQRNLRSRMAGGGVTSYLQPQNDPTHVGTGVGTGIEKEALADQLLVIYDRAHWEAVVAPLLDALLQAQIPAWVEQYLTPGGDDWYAALDQARQECWMLLVVVSAEVFEADHLVKLLRHFHNREKPILLLDYQFVERLPMGANQARHIPYTPGDPQIAFGQVIRAIRQLRGN
jgi:pSer/pThr/pTyr-binding forkhead associated (FHA) protein